MTVQETVNALDLNRTVWIVINPFTGTANVRGYILGEEGGRHSVLVPFKP